MSNSLHGQDRQGVENSDLEKLKIDRSAQRTAGRFRRRIPWRFVFFALAVLLGVAAAMRWFSRGIEVETATVKRVYPSQAYTLLSATGYVVPQTKADVASKATGRLERLDVQEGSHVRKGQVIAELEDEDVVAGRKQAAANIHLAEAEEKEARAELTESDLRLRRAQALIEKNFIARQALDAEIARNDRARAALNSARARIAAAQAEFEAARVAEEYTRIRAPFDGIILTKNADIGDVVAPFSSSIDSKAAVVTMADMDTLEVEADVSESNLLKVEVGQPCEIELDALPDRKLRGRVNRIVPTVDRSKATILVKVSFVDKDERLLPDMSAKVAFLSKPLSAEERKPRKAVPSAAIVKNPGPSVFVVEQERVKRVPVETGMTFDDFIEIRRGLQAGDEVVVDPPAALKDGARIRERSD
ncbi:MAG: efflux RND transporter periplasmic adaptor subunit [Methylothermaceae bacterium]|nr:efflux RND transporter periplasmic adaptor subunit [Methylothermaceae bacterium]